MIARGDEAKPVFRTALCDIEFSGCTLQIIGQSRESRGRPAGCRNPWRPKIRIDQQNAAPALANQRIRQICRETSVLPSAGMALEIKMVCSGWLSRIR